MTDPSHTEDADDRLVDVVTEVARRMGEETNSARGVIEAYATEAVELLVVTLPGLLDKIAQIEPAVVLDLCETWTANARKHLGGQERRLSASWEDRFTHALQAVYAAADVTALMKAEGIGALSTILRQRVEETGEDPGKILRRISENDRAFALTGADAPGAFLANRVRGLGR